MFGIYLFSKMILKFFSIGFRESSICCEKFLHKKLKCLLIHKEYFKWKKKRFHANSMIEQTVISSNGDYIYMPKHHKAGLFSAIIQKPPQKPNICSYQS